MKRGSRLPLCFAGALLAILLFASLSGARGNDAPFVKLRPDALSFADQLVATPITTSNPQYVTIINHGAGPLTFDVPSVTSDHGEHAFFGEFAVKSWNCPEKLEREALRPNKLEPDATCTVGVVFSPRALGARSAMLEIKDDASNSPQQVALSGTGTATASPARVEIDSFGGAEFHEQPQTSETPPSQWKDVTLKNVGTDPITISDVFLGGYDPAQFFIAKHSRYGGEALLCGKRTLAAHESCDVYVGFHPTRPGVMTTILKITDNAPDSPQQAAFTGRAPPTARGEFNKKSMSFAQPVGKKSAEQGVRLTNVGDAPLVISDVVVDSPAQGFEISDANCKGKTLPPMSAESCRVYVTWTPPATSKNPSYPKYSDFYAETRLRIESPYSHKWANWSHGVELIGKLLP